ncbi:hypothetical protein [Parabacteroides distasonis]|uniref:hypothetical protein n=1 Tax=Parabacteroides distasonis TaxID=823 RepID=UPI00321B16E5
MRKISVFIFCLFIYSHFLIGQEEIRQYEQEFRSDRSNVAGSDCLYWVYPTNSFLQ